MSASRICTRCGEVSKKAQKSGLCCFCEEQLGMWKPDWKDARKTHCINGHAMVEGNVVKDGRCATCQKNHERKRQQERKLEKAEAL